MEWFCYSSIQKTARLIPSDKHYITRRGYAIDDNIKTVSYEKTFDHRLEGMKKKYFWAINIIFFFASIALLGFLIMAPEVTTPRLPQNPIHIKFQSMQSKKEAERYCSECHAPEKEFPLSQKHPPEYRCLFCHRRDN